MQAFLHGLDLLFCQHHGRQYMAKLVEVADEIGCVPVPP